MQAFCRNREFLAESMQAAVGNLKSANVPCCRFHVDDLSSAHVYLRRPKGKGLQDIPLDTLQDCCQLVKANSIQGNKVDNLSIVYTPVSNLKKTASMEIGQVRLSASPKLRYRGRSGVPFLSLRLTSCCVICMSFWRSHY
jgi:hypothetical protein